MAMRRPAVLSLLCLLGAFSLRSADKLPRVLNGIDVLREENFTPLAGKRVGLITNQTGLAADGKRTIDLLQQSKVCTLSAIFSPEHGIRGNMDAEVDSSVDESTGLPVYSLYGNSRKPATEMLTNIDALVYDIQDIGARFYTYSTTLAYCMEASAKASIPFFVLDRPNPIGGKIVEGPMLDPDKTSFTGYMPLPVRHGMTIGELARFFNTENKIGAQLHVIAMKNWNRSYYFWDTGQLWVNPSPNMRSMAAAVLYPGVCLLEATNVSVGRGTEKPFECIGAPWIEPRRLAVSLRAAQMPGVKFVPVFFNPRSDKHRGEICGGIDFVVTDVGKFRSVLLGLTLISVLHKLYPEEFDIENVIDLLGNADALKRLKAGQLPAEIIRTGNSDLLRFMAKRRKILIYDPGPNREEGRH